MGGQGDAGAVKAAFPDFVHNVIGRRFRFVIGDRRRRGCGIDLDR
jgi:hypothetical protein